MRKSFVNRLLLAIGTVVAMTVPVGVGVVATSGTAGAADPCTFSVTGGGTLVNPGLITGAVAGSTVVNADCTGVPSGTYVMVESTLLAGIVTPLSGQADLADTGHLAFLSGDIGAFTLPSPFAAADPNAQCGPSTVQINSGIIGCTVAVANISTHASVGSVVVNYASSPNPAPPTLVLSPATAAPGQTVSVSEAPGHTSYWWGNYSEQTSIAPSDVTVGGSTASASSVSISPASYLYTGPSGTLTSPVLTGAFTVPCSASNGSQPVTITQPNQTGLPLTVSATATLTITGGGGGCISSVSPDHGPTSGGTQVTITGTGFTGSTAVHFGSTPATSFHVASDTSITAVAPPGHGKVAVSVTTPAGVTSTTPDLANSFQYGFNGYNLVGADGGVFGFGDATFHGSLGGQHLNGPIVGSATTPDGGGYWLVGSDGGVFAFGDAKYSGSMGGTRLNEPIVGIAATSDGGGYWLAGADGGVFAFGDAKYSGSMGGTRLNEPIVGIAATSDGGGYWLAGADGGVFAFGDAGFRGSAAGVVLAKPVVGISSADSGGYVLVAADGGVFNYGDATFAGSAGGKTLNAPIVGIVSVDTGGYWLAAADGGVFAYGDAPYAGSMGGTPLNAPMAGAAAA